MTLYIEDAELNGYHPGSTEPDYSIPSEHIYSFDVEKKVGDIKDTGKLAIDNDKDRYTNLIGHGDRFDITIFGEDIAGEPGFGVGGFGVGPFGGSEDTNAWTGLVRDYDLTYEGASDCTLKIDAEDFVFSVMSFRKVYNEWRDRQIVGSNGIVNEVLEDHCPEIDTSLLPNRSDTTSIGVFGDSVMTLVGELALRLPAVVYSLGEHIRFEHPDSLSPRFDLETKDYGTPTIGSQDENVKSLVRVRGGKAPQIDDEQTIQDGSVTVTDSDFATQRIDTRKSYVNQIDLYTIADRTGEDIIVRLQKDVGDGSGPIAPDDDTSDISSRRLTADVLDDDGYTLFLMPADEENILPEPNPWMIVQTDGSEGQDIGIDTATGNLAYRAFYPYPIVIEQEDGSSSDRFRLREGEVSNKSISTFDQARDKARSYLSDHGQPTKTMKFNADSVRMHTHNVGNSVQVEEPAAEGAFVAVEKKDHYEGNQLTTDFSLQALNSFST